MGSITLDAGKGATATAAFSDAQGTPQVPLAPPAWSSSDPTVADVAAAPDGLTAIVTAVAAGSAIITCTATNADGVLASGSGDVSVTVPAANTDIVNVAVDLVAN